MNNKKFGLLAAISIVIANMVGTGVFTSLGFQLLDLKNMNAIIALWVIGGIIAILGSFCYAELSSAFPRSGGEYHFLRLAYNDATGFLSGWTSAFLGFAAPIAASAFAFAKYFNKVIPGDYSPNLISIGIVILITIVHTYQLKVGERFQILFTIGKVILITFFIICGFLFHNNHPIDITGLTHSSILDDFNNPGFWIGLIFVSYAYSGWNASAYIIDDVHEPQKTVPRSILIGTLIVTVLYVSVNYVFLIAAPANEMMGKEEVAHVAATYILGKTGAIIVSGMISFFLISTISSMVIVGPRVIGRIASDYHQFSFYAQLNKNGIPVRAILLQSIIAIVLILTSSFEFIITFIGFILSVFTTMTAIGLIILRIKNPNIKRTYKVPLYPLTPILFALFNTWTMWYLFTNKPEAVIASVIFLFIGFVVYLFLAKKSNSKVLLGLIFSAFIFTSCNQTKKENEVAPVLDSTSVMSGDKLINKESASFLDKNATLIAGLDTTSIKSPSTKMYIRNLNNIWEAKTNRFLYPIRNWMKSTGIDDSVSAQKLVFYPFSGPDFEFANTFYPDADEYILCGLEKSGSDSSLIFSKNIIVDSFIKSAGEYFYYANRFGFFRTLDMEKQFDKTGVVDIISFYMKRAGAKINNVVNYHWNQSTGQFMTPDTTFKPNVCYFEMTLPSGKSSKLYYFSKDLSDAGMQIDKKWLNWVFNESSNKQMVSMVKSASYLMHTTYFSAVRNFILKNSKLHIQDDSGIAYSYMAASGRKLNLFGMYTQVIPLFKNKLQPEMIERYKSDSIKSLPFGIGYNMVYKESNLQILFR